MRAISSAWKHIRRSPYQASAAILTMFLTFLLGGIFFLTTLSSMFILKFFESKPQITVFFTDKAETSDIDTLKGTLEQTGKVSTIKFVSKDEALTIYQEQNKDDPLLLEMVTADILPASLEVTALEPMFLQELEPIILQSANIEEVVYQKDVVDSLLVWTRAIRSTGLVLATLLAIDSLLIVMTVIGMKIALKRDEVEILRLVGASPWYIRMPFIIEGGLYGAFGAFGAWIIITGLAIWLSPVIRAFLGVVPEIALVLSGPTDQMFLLSAAGFFAGMSALGFLLGSLGSMIAVGRFLKV